jgi:hypothetical protein
MTQLAGLSQILSSSPKCSHLPFKFYLSLSQLKMTSQIVPPGKINFAGMVGAKRRRMRSGGNVSTLTNNTPKPGPEMDPSDMEDDDDERTATTSKCKQANTIPIFLKSKRRFVFLQ